MALSLGSWQTASARKLTDEGPIQEPKLTLKLEYRYGKRGQETPTYVVTGFDPKESVSIYYTTVANYDAAKEEARKKEADPVKVATWKQVLTKSISLKPGNYYFRVVWGRSDDSIWTKVITEPVRVQKDMEVVLPMY